MEREEEKRQLCFQSHSLIPQEGTQGHTQTINSQLADEEVCVECSEEFPGAPAAHASSISHLLYLRVALIN